MRKLNKPINKKLPSIKLYLDDIEAIYDILETKVNKIDISTDDYAIEDIKAKEDIKQISMLQTNKINKLSIKCSFPNINVNFDTYTATIYFSEDTTQNRGILSEIEEIINKRKVSLRRQL